MLFSALCSDVFSSVLPDSMLAHRQRVDRGLGLAPAAMVSAFEMARPHARGAGCELDLGHRQICASQTLPEAIMNVVVEYRLATVVDPHAATSAGVMEACTPQRDQNLKIGRAPDRT